jgi:antitoxin (DNA-binding transcriptional repressor) of toxin-antitoxin stability system
MRVVTPLEIRRSLGAILDAASAGERFLVERDHRPLAMLVSVEDGRRLEDDPQARRDRRRRALERLAALGESIRPNLPAESDAVTALRLERQRDDRRP